MEFVGFRADQPQTDQAYKEQATLLDPPSHFTAPLNAPGNHRLRGESNGRKGKQEPQRRQGLPGTDTSSSGQRPRWGRGPAVTTQDPRIRPTGYRGKARGPLLPGQRTRRPAPLGFLLPQVFNLG